MNLERNLILKMASVLKEAQEEPPHSISQLSALGVWPFMSSLLSNEPDTYTEVMTFIREQASQHNAWSDYLSSLLISAIVGGITRRLSHSLTRISTQHDVQAEHNVRAAYNELAYHINRGIVFEDEFIRQLDYAVRQYSPNIQPMTEEYVQTFKASLNRDANHYFQAYAAEIRRRLRNPFESDEPEEIEEEIEESQAPMFLPLKNVRESALKVSKVLKTAQERNLRTIDHFTQLRVWPFVNRLLTLGNTSTYDGALEYIRDPVAPHGNWGASAKDFFIRMVRGAILDRVTYARNYIEERPYSESRLRGLAVLLSQLNIQLDFTDNFVEELNIQAIHFNPNFVPMTVEEAEAFKQALNARTNDMITACISTIRAARTPAELPESPESPESESPEPEEEPMTDPASQVSEDEIFKPLKYMKESILKLSTILKESQDAGLSLYNLEDLLRFPFSYDTYLRVRTYAGNVAEWAGWSSSPSNNFIHLITSEFIRGVTNYSTTFTAGTYDAGQIDALHDEFIRIFNNPVRVHPEFITNFFNVIRSVNPRFRFPENTASHELISNIQNALEEALPRARAVIEQTILHEEEEEEYKDEDYSTYFKPLAPKKSRSSLLKLSHILKESQFPPYVIGNFDQLNQWPFPPRTTRAIINYTEERFAEWDVTFANNIIRIIVDRMHENVGLEIELHRRSGDTTNIFFQLIFTGSFINDLVDRVGQSVSDYDMEMPENLKLALKVNLQAATNYVLANFRLRVPDPHEHERVPDIYYEEEEEEPLPEPDEPEEQPLTDSASQRPEEDMFKPLKEGILKLSHIIEAQTGTDRSIEDFNDLNTFLFDPAGDKIKDYIEYTFGLSNEGHSDLVTNSNMRRISEIIREELYTNFERYMVNWRAVVERFTEEDAIEAYYNGILETYAPIRVYPLFTHNLVAFLREVNPNIRFALSSIYNTFSAYLTTTITRALQSIRSNTRSMLGLPPVSPGQREEDLGEYLESIEETEQPLTDPASQVPEDEVFKPLKYIKESSLQLYINPETVENIIRRWRKYHRGEVPKQKPFTISLMEVIPPSLRDALYQLKGWKLEVALNAYGTEVFFETKILRLDLSVSRDSHDVAATIAHEIQHIYDSYVDLHKGNRTYMSPPTPETKFYLEHHDVHPFEQEPIINEAVQFFQMGKSLSEFVNYFNKMRESTKLPERYEDLPGETRNQIESLYEEISTNLISRANTCEKLIKLSDFLDGIIILDHLDDLTKPPFPPSTIENIHNLMTGTLSQYERCGNWQWSDMHEIGRIIGTGLREGLTQMRSRGELPDEIITSIETNSDYPTITTAFFQEFFEEARNLTGRENWRFDDVSSDALARILSAIKEDITEHLEEFVEEVFYEESAPTDMFKLFRKESASDMRNLILGLSIKLAQQEISLTLGGLRNFPFIYRGDTYEAVSELLLEIAARGGWGPRDYYNIRQSIRSIYTQNVQDFMGSNIAMPHRRGSVSLLRFHLETYINADGFFEELDSFVRSINPNFPSGARINYMSGSIRRDWDRALTITLDNLKLTLLARLNRLLGEEDRPPRPEEPSGDAEDIEDTEDEDTNIDSRPLERYFKPFD